MRCQPRHCFALLIFLIVVLPVAAEDAEDTKDAIDAGRGTQSSDFGQPSGLPRPSATPIRDFEEQLFSFVDGRKYVDLGWHVDKRVRDTGPWIRGWYYGTHPAVRIYYSPEMLRWLTEGKSAAIPDGAAIIKEHFSRPAALHDGKDDAQLARDVSSWTVMIKDSRGSYDGWFWSNPVRHKDGTVHAPKNNHQYGFDHPESGFGHYCIRCHASTESFGATNEYTFSSLRNIKGQPGHPVLFRVDNTWRTKTAKLKDTSSHPRCTGGPGATKCPTQLDPAFLEQFSSIPEQSESSVEHIPPVTYDWVVRAPADKIASQQFVTSNQCMSCHAALVGEFGPVMFVHTVDDLGHRRVPSEYKLEGIDYSPYGEWRWTPMGLAGRDPVFYAQLDTELAILEEEFKQEPAKRELISKKLVTTCLRCHGAMGKHQFDLDHADTDEHYTLNHVKSHSAVTEIPDRDDMYGALSRDGISCTICHRMQERPQPEGDKRPYLQYFLETSITGNYHLGPPGEIYGPFKDKEIAPYIMEHALGYKPKHSEYLSSSQMCGTCHAVNLPVVDWPYKPGEKKNELARAESVPEFRDFHHHVEQATYLEWLNSEYQDELGPENPQAQSCQDCHMSRDLHSAQHDVHLANLTTRIAIVQDNNYPDAENLTSHENLNIRYREKGYSRHNFSGLNVFLLEMFNQFDKVLGVRKRDFMTGTEQIPNAMENFELTARQKTADLSLRVTQTKPGWLDAAVLVESKVGHRFPSGVGFRRAFLELSVIDESTENGKVVWASGRTNELGIILGSDGKPLPTEFFDRSIVHNKQYQPHHELITSRDQVQIYETLLYSRSNQFTTSFIHGCTTVKDNRLLPRGWSHDGPDPSALNGYFLKSTYPVGVAAQDPRYADGSGSDETVYRIQLPAGVEVKNVIVKATLYYQALPPYFLKNIFEIAPESKAARRLHYLCANMNLEGTLIEDWKLEVASAVQKISKSFPDTTGPSYSERTSRSSSASETP